MQADFESASREPALQTPGGVYAEFLVWVIVLGALLVVAQHLIDWWAFGPFHLGVLAMSLWLAGVLVLAATSRPWVTTPEQERWLADQRVAVVVPFFNEDPALLGNLLDSLTRQTRTPEAVWLIDDGSTSDDCLRISRSWAGRQEFEVYVHRLDENIGKRHAQSVAFARDPAEIIVTVDSDSILDLNAIAEGIKPLADPTIHAVSASIVGLNWRSNLLTRVVDIEFVNSFVVGRSAMNRFKAMSVTCGVMAVYRGWVVRRYLSAYVSQTFLGSKVRAGDDRDLTQFAMLEGRTVHQESSVAYTALPESVSHLFRQRFRWSSSLYRGIVWVTGHLPASHPAYWVLTFQAVVVMCAFVAWGWLIVWEPVVNGNVHFGYIGYMFGLGYLRSLRYLVAERRNQTTRQRWGNYLLSPLIAPLYMLLLTPTLYAAMFGVREKKWFTRDSIEVTLDLRDLPDPLPGDSGILESTAPFDEAAVIDLTTVDLTTVDLTTVDLTATDVGGKLGTAGHGAERAVTLPAAGTGRRRELREAT